MFRRIAYAVILTGLVAAALLVSGGPAPSASTPAPQVSGAGDQAALEQHLRQARTELAQRGREVTARGASPTDLMTRLDTDLSAVSLLDSSTPANTKDAVMVASTLDASLVDQLTSGVYIKPADVRGAGELLVQSSVDKSMQPLALYVPASAFDARNAPLIMMLPGQGETESQLVAVSFLRDLAERTGAIFAASPARGDSTFDGAGGQDVYDALAMLETSLHLDQRRVYLSGVSLGGFGMFVVAPQHPDRWKALMAIASSLTNDDKTAVVRAFVGKQIFLVAGSDDPLIKAQYVRGATAYLNDNGVEASYYEQPRGVHSLQSLQPAVERAWRDMFSGVRNVAPGFELPSPVPTGSTRT